MKKLIVVMLLLFSVSSIRANSITITFYTPVANTASDSSLLVSVGITSTFSLSSIVATVENHSVNLVFDQFNNDFRAYLPLSGLQKGVPLLLTVVATDAFNNQQSVSENFIYAPPPTVTIIAPYEYSNAYPSIHVKGFTVSIDDTCHLEIKVDFNGIIFIKDFIGSVDTVINIQPTSGRGRIYFTATDKWGQQGGNGIDITFNNSIYLTEVFSSPNKIVDFNYNKVLTQPANNGFIHVYPILTDLVAQTATTLTGFYNNDYFGLPASFITPYGVFTGLDQTQDWNNGVLYQVNAGGYYSQVAGKYAEWMTGQEGDLYLRDLSTLTNTLAVPYNSVLWGHYNNNIGSDGSIVFQNNYQLFKYKDGVTGAISTLTNGGIIYQPLIDSGRVVFLKRDDPTGGTLLYVYMHDGTSEIMLSFLGDFAGQVIEPWPDQFNYKKYLGICHKYVAFCKPDVGAKMQVWLRDSTGASSQRTFFGTSSYIEAVNPNGDIFYNDGGRRYLAKNGPLQTPVDYGPVIGSLLYRDSSWYVIEGIHLYRLMTNAFMSVNNGNWNDPNTWADGVVPPPNADVIILNNVTVNVNATCNTLNIHAPGTITVAPGINLVVIH